MKVRYINIFAGCIACANAAVVTPPLDSEGMQALVTREKLLSNLKDLERIAYDNGGNRAFGLPGFTASLNYVKSHLATSNKYKSWTQDFTTRFRQQAVSFTVAGKTYFVASINYSTNGPDTTFDVTAPVVKGPVGAAACSPDAYSTLDVKDKIVIVGRGDCPDGQSVVSRIRPALSAGAAAIIIHMDTQEGSDTLRNSILQVSDPQTFRPTAFMDYKDGLSLLSLLEAGEPVSARFVQTFVEDTRTTQNLFAESIAGDPNNVIMLGAHLDSVQDGPGINDDGSGTSLLITIFHALQNYLPKNKIRLAWWGAEELGLVGSRYYTSNLSKAEANSILLYLNFDMVSRGYYGVFDGDGKTHGLAGPPGSDVIEKLFIDHLVAKGIPVTAAVFTGGSDYASFMSTLKKPVGGMHSGTGVAQDPCYHRRCDNYSNANGTHLEVIAKATAHVLSVLSNEGDKIIPKALVEPSMDGRMRMDMVDSFPWTTVEGDEHLAVCGGHDNYFLEQ
ncbi:uncharacterized protein DFL_005967 [Arthrobotrys flagrans]|uniref:Peptide hydrolase n=1 Tax=Arthrobotrys flagrans TaxID=97331 RepID=A0A436ZZL7_ARTFL|nr:hypothetical protein DFL_005967 [Arthrobotrys flagrans]